jgi:hypothetical protein
MIAAPKSEEVAGFNFDLVGRSQVISQLVTEWDKFLGGEGGVCALSGESGVGKSRLASEFASYAKQRAHLWLHRLFIDVRVKHNRTTLFRHDWLARKLLPNSL